MKWSGKADAAMAGLSINVDNFVRSETDHMFATIAHEVGGTGSWSHGKIPTAIDTQPVIGVNHDTPYSAAVVDVGHGRCINRVFHSPGDHKFGTEFVITTARIPAAPENPKWACPANNVAGVPTVDGSATVNSDRDPGTRMPFPSWRCGSSPSGPTAHEPWFLRAAGRFPGSHPGNRRAAPNERKGRSSMVLL